MFILYTYYKIIKLLCFFLDYNLIIVLLLVILNNILQNYLYCVYNILYSVSIIYLTCKNYIP